MSRKFKFTIIALLLFTLWTGFSWFLAEKLIVEKPLEHAEAIVILGGSSVYLERTRRASGLFENGVAPKILLTDDGERAGWSRTEQRNTPFVELAKSELIAQGVSPESIEIIKPAGSGTIYEAEELQKIAAERNLKTVLLVTSAYHTRRALWIFERVLAKDDIEIGIRSAPPGVQTPEPFLWWLTPFGWRVVGGEYVKLAYYWIRY